MPDRADEVPSLSDAELRLAVLRDAWDSAGSPAQGGVAWNRESWQRWLPDFADLLDGLEDRIDRATVTEHFRRAEDEAGVVGAFVVAMLWGHGSSGYGAWRTRRILLENQDAASRLTEAMKRVRQSPLEGYRSMGYYKPCSLKYLGPAFGTKFLCFAADDTQPAPILDALIARWISRMTDGEVVISATQWRPTDYEQYLAMLDSWAGSLNVTVAAVERLIFADSSANLSGSGRRANQWAESWVPATVPVG